MFANFLSLIFSFSNNKKALKKYLNGEHRPTEDELCEIQHFLESRNEISKKEIIIQQIEQRKVPYLDEISVNELNFLLSKSVDFYGLLDVVMAKGGLTRGLATIKWDGHERRYKKVSLPKFLGEIVAIAFSIVCITIWLFSAGWDYTVYGIRVSWIVIPALIIFNMPFVMLTDNTISARRKLEEEHPNIFE